MNFNSLRDAYREEVIRTRRAFHAAPELSGHEWNTAERIRAILTGAGIPWEPCGKELPGTLVTIDGVGAGKTILLRADIDARKRMMFPIRAARRASCMPAGTTVTSRCCSPPRKFSMNTGPYSRAA